MALMEKRIEYRKGKIEKHEYFKQMFKVHKHLFEYPAFIKGTSIREIIITSDQVEFSIYSEGNNIKVCCNEEDSYSLPMSCLNLSAYEAAEIKMILQIIKPGDVVFDIGANIGWHTINILLQHKGSSVYSFEPIKASYEYLVKNLVLNGLNTDRAYNIGFSNENKKMRFYFDVRCAMASSMANLREDKNTVMVECEVKRMDDFISSNLSLNKLDFIKCDVEGGELFVFKGGIETIKKYKPIIFTEMLRKWSGKFNYHPNDIIKLFSNIGYKCYVINGGKIEEFGLVEDDTLQTNYIFLHTKKHADVIGELVSLR